MASWSAARRRSIERPTCVFPNASIIESLTPGTFLFSEHPVMLEDDVIGFEPLPRDSFETLRERGISFFHAHGPLDHHPDVSPSRLCALGIRVDDFEEYFPIADGIPGGAAVIGNSEDTLDELAGRLQGFLGEESRSSLTGKASPSWT
jgi:putative NIF3 family GTP cyclohydrolase 1 type 2